MRGIISTQCPIEYPGRFIDIPSDAQQGVLSTSSAEVVVAVADVMTSPLYLPVISVEDSLSPSISLRDGGVTVTFLFPILTHPGGSDFVSFPNRRHKRITVI